MKVAELFAALGFKVENLDAVVAVRRELEGIAGLAGQLAEPIKALQNVALVAAQTVRPAADAAAAAFEEELKGAQALADEYDKLQTASGKEKAKEWGIFDRQARAAARAAEKAAAAEAKKDAAAARAAEKAAAAEAKKESQQQVAAREALNKATRKVGLTVAAAAASVAMLVHQVRELAVQLQSFNRTTGLSTTSLQMYQRLGEVAGVSAERIQGAFEQLQEARAGAEFGQLNTAWGMLGVMPGEDPVQTIEDLRLAIQGLEPRRARFLLSQLGLEDLLPLLRASESEFKALNAAVTLSPEAVERMTEFHRSWSMLKTAGAGALNQFLSAVIPVLTQVLQLITPLVTALAKFAHWLNGTSALAKGMRTVLGVFAALLGVLAFALAAIATQLFVITPLIAAFNLALGALALNPVGLVILGIAAAIAGIIIVFKEWAAVTDDLTGSLRKLGEEGSMLRTLANSLADVVNFMGTAGRAIDWITGGDRDFASVVPDAFKARGGATNSTVINQSNSINYSGQPDKAARATVSEIDRSLAAAFREAPAYAV